MATAYLAGQPEVGAVLALGLEALLCEKERPDAPAMWLATWLKRNHPAHNARIRALVEAPTAYRVGQATAAAAVAESAAAAVSAVAASTTSGAVDADDDDCEEFPAAAEGRGDSEAEAHGVRPSTAPC
jgi:hypothetical protein